LTIVAISKYNSFITGNQALPKYILYLERNEKMPIYSYRCKECSNNFELLVGVTADSTEKKCPQCGSQNIEKTLSSFSFKMGSSSAGTPSGGACSTGGCCPTC
jgi:putative FmdB family regulatory protein